MGSVKEVSQHLSGKSDAVLFLFSFLQEYGCGLIHTQLFSASQQVLLIRQDVVKDKQLGSDGKALSSSSTTVPLLKKEQKERTTALYHQKMHSIFKPFTQYRSPISS